MTATVLSLTIPCLILLTIFLILRFIGNRLAGYAAKNACSLLNITKLSLKAIKEELHEDSPLFNLVKIKYEKDTGKVVCSFLGIIKRTAIYRPPFGAVLVYQNYKNIIKNYPKPSIREKCQTQDFIETADSNIEHNLHMKKALDYAFSEPENPKTKRRTRAVLVIHKNRIIAEQYASGFSKDTVFPGWSMTKSILNLALGVRVQQGKIDISKKRLRNNWKNDSRAEISIENLLRMESGLKWQEAYTAKSSALTMLTCKANIAKYVASFKKTITDNQPLKFNYSSGSTNIISQLLRESFNNDNEYINFLWNNLFIPLGLKSAQPEFDASGTWVASSFLFATARDWARFGKFVLDKGKVQEKQIIPDWWMNKSTTPGLSYRPCKVTGNKQGLAYGMHWWLNKKDRNGENWMSDVPEDTVSAIGHLGQFLTIIPSCNLIVVRLGLSRGQNKWDHNYFLNNIIHSINKDIKK